MDRMKRKRTEAASPDSSTKLPLNVDQRVEMEEERNDETIAATEASKSGDEDSYGWSMNGKDFVTAKPAITAWLVRKCKRRFSFFRPKATNGTHFTSSIFCLNWTVMLIISMHANQPSSPTSFCNKSFVFLGYSFPWTTHFIDNFCQGHVSILTRYDCI